MIVSLCVFDYEKAWQAALIIILHKKAVPVWGVFKTHKPSVPTSYPYAFSEEKY